MGTYRIATLPGDGVGPEVTAQALRVLRRIGELHGHEFAFTSHPFGAAGYHEAGDPFPAATREAVLAADAVLLGAVGDPAVDHLPKPLKPETGLLALRKALGVFANLRPAIAHPALAAVSPLKPERIAGIDILVVRELLGGLYFGEPRWRQGDEALNTLRYTVPEVERVARVAFEAARVRRHKVTSVDKANVLETSQLWREVVTRMGKEYPDVTLEHRYVDVTAMLLITRASDFDVLLTENLFGDILSDEASVLAGSLGMLPSASTGPGAGLFEPVHGSAPDIAGRGIANPIGAILSAAMLLRYGLRLHSEGVAIEKAVYGALDAGARTRDIAVAGDTVLDTSAMTDVILRQLPAG